MTATISIPGYAFATFRYRCYLEAYTQARCGGVVHGRTVIAEVAGDDPEDELFEDVSIARAIAIGASDGVHRCPKPMNRYYFDHLLQTTENAKPPEAP